MSKHFTFFFSKPGFPTLQTDEKFSPKSRTGKESSLTGTLYKHLEFCISIYRDMGV